MNIQTFTKYRPRKNTSQDAVFFLNSSNSILGSSFHWVIIFVWRSFFSLTSFFFSCLYKYQPISCSVRFGIEKKKPIPIVCTRIKIK